MRRVVLESLGMLTVSLCFFLACGADIDHKLVQIKYEYGWRKVTTQYRPTGPGLCESRPPARLRFCGRLVPTESRQKGGEVHEDQDRYACG